MLDWLWNGIFKINDHLRNKAKINDIVEYFRQDKSHENSDLNSNSRIFNICKSISEITVGLTVQILRKISIPR